MFVDTFGGQKHVQTGYTFVSSAGLDVTVAAGTAFAAGTRIDRDVTTVVAATDSATNYIFVYYKDDLDDNIVYFHVDQDDTPPSGYTATSQKIMEVVASGGVITSDTDKRELGPQAQVKTSGGVKAGTSIVLDGLADLEGRIQMAGANNGLVMVRQDRTTRFPGSPVAGDRFLWYAPTAASARLFTDVQNDLLLVTNVGQLQLPKTGSAAGIRIGGDTDIYRSAAGILHTPDTFESEVFFHGRSGGGAGAAFRVGNDAEIHDVNVPDQLAIVGAQTPANGRLAFGEDADTVIFRGAANRLDLAGGDFFRWVGGTSDPSGLADGAVWYRTDTDRLRLRAAGATENLAYISDLGTGAKSLFRDAQVMTAVFGSPSLVENNNTMVWALDADAVAERVFFLVNVPDDCDTSQPITVEIVWMPSNTGGGNVRWQIFTNAYTAGEAHSGGLAETLLVTDATDSSSVVKVVSAGTIPAADFDADDFIRVRVARLGSDGADTYTADAHLIGIKLKYTAG